MDITENFLLETQIATIKSLEDLIGEIKSGEVLEFIGMKTMVNGDTGYVGGKTADRQKTAGMLLELAIERLRQDNSKDDED